MRIAIIGSGPSGAWSSILLARQGHSVTLIDPQAPWEKPCGGGVTAKALSSFGIFESALPRKPIDRITIFYGDRYSVSVTPELQVAVVSRLELGKFLIEEAEKAGVSFLRDRAIRITSIGREWTVTTKHSTLNTDFLVGADGVTSFVRRTVGTPLRSDDLCMTMGYFIPGDGPPHMKIYFVPSFEGYIWSFPRSNHISYGLIARTEPGWTARARRLLSNFIVADLGADAMTQAEFYSAPVPCLSPRSWTENRISGPGWALTGDAAGLTDSITGEGIYYAFKSAEILAGTIESPESYASRVWQEIGRELAQAADMYGRFYRGSFMGADFRKRMVQMAEKSRTLKVILGDLVAGNQSYSGLKRKLFLSLPAIGLDLIAGRSGP